MFGSEIVKTLVYQKMSTNSEVTAAIGTRMRSMEIVPLPESTPALLFYPINTGYDGALGGAATSQQLSYDIKFICHGISTDPIWDAAEAQYAEFASKSFDIVIRGSNYQVSFTEREEILPTTIYEAGEYYRVLGTSYDVHVTKG